MAMIPDLAAALPGWEREVHFQLKVVFAGRRVLAGQVGFAEADLEGLKTLIQARVDDGNYAGLGKLGLMVATLGKAVDAAGGGRFRGYMRSGAGSERR